jgi:hypothetical protein
VIIANSYPLTLPIIYCGRRTGVFVRWLELTLRQQREDVTRHLGHGALGNAHPRQLRDRNAFRDLPSSETASYQLDLFTNDLA